MSEKKLSDITRRQFLKGAAKVAGATALPGSGLASIGEAVKMGLDINQKLDLTKNILQGLAQNNLTSRENKIFTLLKSFTTDGGRLSDLTSRLPSDIFKGTGALERYKNPEEYKKNVFKAITQNKMPISNDFVEPPTMEEINTVLEKKSVGFFAYILDKIFDIFLFLLGVFGIAIIVGFVALIFDKNEEEDEEIEEENKYGMDFEAGDEVEIPEREQLESMTKDEIKAWADVFEFNVPLSLTRVEMIQRFIDETDAYVESLEE